MSKNAKKRCEENPGASIEEAIAGLESFPLTELQQRLVNYLRSNVDDVAEALDLEIRVPRQCVHGVPLEFNCNGCSDAMGKGRRVIAYQ